MPPACVKPYVKRQKNDMADAEEADTSANMRFVPTKTLDQQSGPVMAEDLACVGGALLA
jgi:transposase